jgi:hypothetical protein
MSRLDSFIRRLMAQRDCLEWAAQAIVDLPGPVLEVGLGNGRTYDHLRELFPDREIFVFERQVQAHPDCIPDDEHLFLGDVFETLPQAIERLGRTVALIHSDVGTGDEARNARLAAGVAPLYAKLLRPGGIAIGDQALSAPGWGAVEPPDDVPPDRYFIYRAGAEGC